MRFLRPNTADDELLLDVLREIQDIVGRAADQLAAQSAIDQIAECVQRTRVVKLTDPKLYDVMRAMRKLRRKEAQGVMDNAAKPAETRNKN